MVDKQLTCSQNVRFIFDFFEKAKWLPGETPPINNILDKNKTGADAVRNLESFLSNRLSRIACMMELLQTSHNDWLITGKKNKIIMETNTFDFNDALSVLKNNGFNDDEYILKIEYERKWGLL